MMYFNSIQRGANTPPITTLIALHVTGSFRTIIISKWLEHPGLSVEAYIYIIPPIFFFWNFLFYCDIAFGYAAKLTSLGSILTLLSIGAGMSAALSAKIPLLQPLD
jgi:hypothetical protein